MRLHPRSLCFCADPQATQAGFSEGGITCRSVWSTARKSWIDLCSMLPVAAKLSKSAAVMKNSLCTRRQQTNPISAILHTHYMTLFGGVFATAMVNKYCIKGSHNTPLQGVLAAAHVLQSVSTNQSLNAAENLRLGIHLASRAMRITWSALSRATVSEPPHLKKSQSLQQIYTALVALAERMKILRCKSLWTAHGPTSHYQSD